MSTYVIWKNILPGLTTPGSTQHTILVRSLRMLNDKIVSRNRLIALFRNIKIVQFALAPPGESSAYRILSTRSTRSRATIALDYPLSLQS